MSSKDVDAEVLCPYCGMPFEKVYEDEVVSDPRAPRPYACYHVECVSAAEMRGDYLPRDGDDEQEDDEQEDDEQEDDE